MSMISHLFAHRTSIYLTRNLFRTSTIFRENRASFSTLPSSNKSNTQNEHILPNEKPLIEQKKSKYNISWKSTKNENN